MRLQHSYVEGKRVHQTKTVAAPQIQRNISEYCKQKRMHHEQIKLQKADYANRYVAMFGKLQAIKDILLMDNSFASEGGSAPLGPPS